MARPFLSLFAAGGLAVSGSAALAQTAPAEPTIFDSDHLVVGLGGALLPSYEGSNDYLVTPAPLVQGSLGGIDFSSRGTAVSADVLPNPHKHRVNWLLGPEVRFNFDRTSRIRDAVVSRLGTRDLAVEMGGFAGVAISALTNPYDTLTARVDVVTDVTGQHDGTLITPSIAFATPVSRSTYVFIEAEATHADTNYTDAFFSVTPAGALASGLPVYAARGGWKNWSTSLGVNYDLDGNLANGGLGLFMGAAYSHLLNDAAASPIVALRGSADQWYGAAGLTYGF